jgi:hypothetical protein
MTNPTASTTSTETTPQIAFRIVCPAIAARPEETLYCKSTSYNRVSRNSSLASKWKTRRGAEKALANSLVAGYGAYVEAFVVNARTAA